MKNTPKKTKMKMKNSIIMKIVNFREHNLCYLKAVRKFIKKMKMSLLELRERKKIFKIELTKVILMKMLHMKI